VPAAEEPLIVLQAAGAVPAALWAKCAAAGGERASAYLKAAGIAVRLPAGWGPASVSGAW